MPDIVSRTGGTAYIITISGQKWSQDLVVSAYVKRAGDVASAVMGPAALGKAVVQTALQAGLKEAAKLAIKEVARRYVAGKLAQARGMLEERALAKLEGWGVPTEALMKGIEIYNCVKLARSVVSKPKPAAASAAVADSGDGKAPKRVTVNRTKHPQAAQHLEDAGGTGRPLTVDRTGTAARRRAAMKGHPTRPGLDRDEVPPAVFREGGSGSSVRHIPPGDNRGAGTTIGNQIRDVPDGGQVIIQVED